jgi:hypothetical protein
MIVTLRHPPSTSWGWPPSGLGISPGQVVATHLASTDSLSLRSSPDPFVPQTIRSDGVGGLYRGFGISVSGIFLYRGLYFGLYDSLKPVVLGKDAGLLQVPNMGVWHGEYEGVNDGRRPSALRAGHP